MKRDVGKVAAGGRCNYVYETKSRFTGVTSEFTLVASYAARRNPGLYKGTLYLCIHAEGAGAGLASIRRSFVHMYTCVCVHVHVIVCVCACHTCVRLCGTIVV